MQLKTKRLLMLSIPAAVLLISAFVCSSVLMLIGVVWYVIIIYFHDESYMRERELKEKVMREIMASKNITITKLDRNKEL